MSTWRVQRHYGFGAARIPLAAECHRGGDAGLRAGLSTMASELFAGGPIAATRRLAGQAPALALGVILLATFVTTLTMDHSDQSPIELVMLETATPEPPPVIEVVEVPPPAPPPPAPEPVRVEPPPPPVEIAEAPKPPPPPVRRPEPRPRPKPVVPQIAKAPTPPPPARPERAEPVRPRPAMPARRPELAMARVQPEPRPTNPPPERLARPERNQPRASARPRPTPTVVPAAPDPASAPPRRSAASGSRPRRGRPPERARSRFRGWRPRRPGAPIPRRPRRARRALSVPRPRPPGAPARPPLRWLPRRRLCPRMRRFRPCRPAAPRRRRRPAHGERLPPRACPPPSPAGPRRRPRRRPCRSRRASRPDPGAAASTPGRDRPAVAGVPLGDLAACVTDREEDRLKQAVVAAVKTQGECVSRKGTYRFVETRNLNAFLMWVDRAPGSAGGRSLCRCPDERTRMSRERRPACGALGEGTRR